MNEESIMNAEKAFSDCCNHTPHAYIDICGDLIAGTLLSQILYWFKPNKDGESKIRVIKGDVAWIAKRREDWWDEVRITAKQYDRAIKLLIDKGYVESKLFRFNGHATTHIRPIPENINKAIDLWKLNKALSYEKQAESSENSQISPKGKTKVSQKGESSRFTERVKLITEYNITENTNKNIKYRDSNIDSSNGLDINTISIYKSEPSGVQHFGIEEDIKIDLHNKGSLADALDTMIRIPKGTPDHDYMYNLFSAFGNAFKKRRGYKHTMIDYKTLERYVGKLTEFKVRGKDQDIDNEDGSIYHTFSIYDYELNEILGMVDDYFSYRFEDCDYSLHHFMSDDVLSTRFWHIENKHTKIAM